MTHIKRKNKKKYYSYLQILGFNLFENILIIFLFGILIFNLFLVIYIFYIFIFVANIYYIIDGEILFISPPLNYILSNGIPNTNNNPIRPKRAMVA